MDLIKSKTVGKSKKGRKKQSKVQQFYSEYNSSTSSSAPPSRSSSLSSENDAEVRVFTFENIRSPRSPTREPAASDANGAATPNPTSRSKSRSRPTTPGVTKNQRIKDEALSIVYQNKIKDLRSNLMEGTLTRAYHSFSCPRIIARAFCRHVAPLPLPRSPDNDCTMVGSIH